MRKIEKLNMDGVVTQDDILHKVNELIDEYNAIRKFEMELNAVWLLINNFCSQATVKKISHGPRSKERGMKPLRDQGA